MVNVDLKQEIHVIIQSKHLFSRILFENFKIKIYKTITLPVVLYGCEAQSLILQEKCRLRVFENRILRRLFGSKRNEIGECRKHHNEEFHSFYRSPNIVRVIKSRRLRWAGYVAKMEECFQSFNGPKRRWEDNIRMDLKEIGINTRNQVDLAQYMDYWRAHLNAGLNLRDP